MLQICYVVKQNLHISLVQISCTCSWLVWCAVFCSPILRFSTSCMMDQGWTFFFIVTELVTNCWLKRWACRGINFGRLPFSKEHMLAISLVEIHGTLQGKALPISPDQW